MNPPKSSSDLQIQVPCVICNGNATFGSNRHSMPTPCESCHGTGWQPGEFDRLNPAQLKRLRTLLPPVPVDPEISYPDADPMTNLGKLLAKRWIETVAFPKNDATTIDLIDKRGNILRVQLASRETTSTPIINAIPLPEPVTTPAP